MGLLLVLSIIFNFHYNIWDCCRFCRLSLIFITIYGIVCVQLAHFSLDDWKDISIDHVIIIKSEVSTFPIVIIFFRGCVPEKIVTPYSVTYCIYILGKPEFLFSLLLRNFWWVQIVGSVLTCRPYSFVCILHHIVIIVQTYLKTLSVWNACQIHFVECVSKIKYIFSYQLCNMWGCVFSVYPFPLWGLREYTLSYYHHHIGSMDDYPLYRISSWNSGMRCMYFYIQYWYCDSRPQELTLVLDSPTTGRTPLLLGREYSVWCWISCIDVKIPVVRGNVLRLPTEVCY